MKKHDKHDAPDQDRLDDDGSPQGGPVDSLRPPNEGRWEVRDPRRPDYTGWAFDLWFLNGVARTNDETQLRIPRIMGCQIVDTQK
jgi:hypothetical protein